MQTEIEKLQQRLGNAKLKITFDSDMMLNFDLQIPFPDVVISEEEIAAEINVMLDAYERGDYRPLEFNDSKRRKE